MGIYKYIRDAWNEDGDAVHALWRQRLIQWRTEESTVRVEKPTRLDRARSLGYKAKPGFVIVRQRVGRGGHARPQIRAGRKPRSFHRVLNLNKNYKGIAEERTQDKYPNLVVLNSYYLAEDGKHYWFEIILVDPAHPVIKADPRLNWTCDPAQLSRTYRGKTSSGQRSRGLRWKGKGVEKARPSRRAHKRRQ